MKRILIILLLVLAGSSDLMGGSAMPPKASQVPNDSTVTGTTVKDVLENLKGNIVPITTHLVVHIASPTGCASGWQTTMSSEVSAYTALGISENYILCIDVSGVANSYLVQEDGTSFILQEDGSSKIIL